MEKNKQNTSAKSSLKCVKYANEKYGLCCDSIGGKLERVPKIGFSARPFEIVGQYPARQMVAVKKYVKTPFGVKPELFLVNTNTGKIPETMFRGVDQITYDTEKQNFYFSPMTRPMYDAEYVRLMILMLLNGLNPNDAASNQNKSPAQIIMADMPGVVITVVPAPTKRRTKKKKRARKKLLRRVAVKQKPNLRGKLKMAPGKSVAKPRKPIRNTKPALRARLTAPYSLRNAPRIKYTTTITSGRGGHQSINPTTLRCMPVPSIMPAAMARNMNMGSDYQR